MTATILLATALALGSPKPVTDVRTTGAASVVGSIIPDVANGYVVVFSPELSDGSLRSVMAMRVDAAGRPASDAVFVANGGALVPGGARSSGFFVVTWMKDTGTEIGFLDDELKLAQTLPLTEPYVNVACSGDHCLAGTLANRALKLYPFAGDGSAIGTAVPVTTACSSVSIVAVAGNFLVAWSDAGGVHVRLFDDSAQSVSAQTDVAGAGYATAAVATAGGAAIFYIEGRDVNGFAWPSGASRTIVHYEEGSDGGYDQPGATYAAWNGSEILLALTLKKPLSIGFEGLQDPSKLFGLRLLPSLDAIDAEPFPIADAGCLNIGWSDASGGTDFLVAFEHSDGCVVTEMEAYVKRVSAGGVVDPSVVGQPLICRPRDVLLAGAGASARGIDLALWTEKAEGLQSIAMAARLTRDGTRLDAQPIALAANAQSVGAATDGRDFFSIAQNFADLEPAIGASGFFIDGASGAATQIALPQGWYFDVAWSGGHYAAPFLDGQTLKLARIVAGSVPAITEITSDLAPFDDLGPVKVASAGGNDVIVWLRFPYANFPPDTTGLFAAAVDASGRIVTYPHRIADAMYGMSVASDGTQVLVVGGVGDTRSILLSADATPIETTLLDESSPGNDVFASGRLGNRWIASWQASGQRIVVTFHTPSQIETRSTVDAADPLLFLTRGDGSAAALVLEQGRVALREVAFVPARRRAAGTP